MRKFTALWIIAIIVFCLGIVLVVAGTASGAKQIITNSPAFFDKIEKFMESNVLGFKETSEVTETINVTDTDDTEIQKLDILLEDYAVSLKPTRNNEISIKYKNIIDTDHPNISITTENGIMTVKGVNPDKTLKNQFVEIYIPAALSPEVSIELKNSAVSVEDVSLTSLVCITENAAISVEDLHCEASVSLSTLRALISVEEIYAPAISINTDTGIISFDSLHFNSLDVINTTGAINGELEARSLYTVTTTRNGKTETFGKGGKTVNITNSTGIINIEYDD